jgi:hypothetical protein
MCYKLRIIGHWERKGRESFLCHVKNPAGACLYVATINLQLCQMNNSMILPPSERH